MVLWRLDKKKKETRAREKGFEKRGAALLVARCDLYRTVRFASVFFSASFDFDGFNPLLCDSSFLSSFK